MMNKLFLTILLTGCFAPTFATEITGGVEYKEPPEKIEVKLRSVVESIGYNTRYDITTNAVDLNRIMLLFCNVDSGVYDAKFVYVNDANSQKDFKINEKDKCKLIVDCLVKDEVTLTLDPASLTVTKAHLGPGCDTKIDPRPYEYTNVLEEDYTLLDV